MRKGDITIKLLEIIAGAAVAPIALFVAFLNAGYEASCGKMNNELGKILESNSNSEKSKNKQKYHSLLHRLKKNGFVAEKKRNGNKFIFLTQKGKIKLQNLKSNRLPAKHYAKEQGDKYIIIIFDIPERERKKRDWLRQALANIGLEMAQKSVWIGKVKIPNEFLKDLHDLKLLDFVEIFEITKSGSLKNIV